MTQSIPCHWPVGNLWLAMLIMEKAFCCCCCSGEGPSVESKNLLKSTSLLLYGNTNLCPRNKTRSYSKKRKAQRWDQRREVSTLSKYGKGSFLCKEALHHLRTRRHVTDLVGLNQAHQDRDGEGTGSCGEEHPQRPRAFLRIPSTG